MSRENLKKYISTTLPTMEIGPLQSPFLKKEEYNVYYSDIKDTDGVINTWKNASGVDETKIVSIDYVIKKTYLDAVGEKRFGAVFSSHVIEHTFDIITHLKEISEILETEGRYVLCIPDKRFTFDYFREVTPFRDAYDVYLNGDEALKRLVLDWTLNNVADWHVSVDGYLNHSLSFNEIAVNSIRVSDAIKNIENIEYVKMGFHYWVFTFISFLALLRDCLRLNLLPYTLEYAGGTILGGNEFYIVLKKNAEIQSDIKLRNTEIQKINNLIENPQGKKQLLEFIDNYKYIYIYGINMKARYLLEKFGSMKEKIKGIIVSDGFEKEDIDLPIYNLSEVELNLDIGIILTMSSENSRNQVKSELLKQGFSNIFQPLYFD